MLELSCLGNCDRCLIRIKQFVPTACKKIYRVLGQQMQSGCALGGRELFEFQQHRFSQSRSTMLLANN